MKNLRRQILISGILWTIFLCRPTWTWHSAIHISFIKKVIAKPPHLGASLYRKCCLVSLLSVCSCLTVHDISLVTQASNEAINVNSVLKSTQDTIFNDILPTTITISCLSNVSSPSCWLCKMKRFITFTAISSNIFIKLSLPWNQLLVNAAQINHRFHCHERHELTFQRPLRGFTLKR